MPMTIKSSALVALKLVYEIKNKQIKWKTSNATIVGG